MMKRAIGIILSAVIFAIVDILFIPSIDIPWTYLFVVAFLAIGCVCNIADAISAKYFHLTPLCQVMYDPDCFQVHYGIFPKNILLFLHAGRYATN